MSHEVDKDLGPLRRYCPGGLRVSCQRNIQESSCARLCAATHWAPVVGSVRSGHSENSIVGLCHQNRYIMHLVFVAENTVLNIPQYLRFPDETKRSTKRKTYRVQLHITKREPELPKIINLVPSPPARFSLRPFRPARNRTTTSAAAKHQLPCVPQNASFCDAEKTLFSAFFVNAKRILPSLRYKQHFTYTLQLTARSTPTSNL